jgi:hypothetical protein
MPVGDDEERAAAYRAQQARREAYRLQMRERLRGSEAAARRQRENWQPIIDAAQEQGVQDDDEVEPVKGHANG